jgi:hypothetical protein
MLVGAGLECAFRPILVVSGLVVVPGGVFMADAAWLEGLGGVVIATSFASGFDGAGGLSIVLSCMVVRSDGGVPGGGFLVGSVLRLVLVRPIVLVKIKVELDLVISVL